jgi:simple sugar transport system permease protein
VVFLSFAVGGVLLLLYRVNPLAAYAALLRGALGSTANLSETLSVTAPLVLIAVGFSMASRCNAFNIGGEGQLYIGALGATLTAVYLPAGLPFFITIPLVMVSGLIFGMLWMALAALMKANYHVNEVVITVMLNEIAAFFVSWLISGPIRDPGSPLRASSQLPVNWRYISFLGNSKLNIGLILAVFCAAAAWFLLNKTVVGFRLRAIGFSEKAARYAGLPIKTLLVFAMLLSGGLAGLAGAGEVAGVHFRLIEGISSGYGYVAITVSLLGKGSPAKILVAGFAYAALIVGAHAMERAVGAPSALVRIIQAVIVLFWIAGEYFTKRICEKLEPYTDIAAGI